MKPTKESLVKRELRTPKYRQRIVEDKTKKVEEEPVDLDDEVCDHNYIKGCPYCRGKHHENN